MDQSTANGGPRFSLIVCTVDRVAPLGRLLASLAAQSMTDFEIIVVDQNADERVAPILGPWLENADRLGTESSPASAKSLRMQRIRAPRGFRGRATRACVWRGGRFWAFPTMTAGIQRVCWPKSRKR